jgi:phosphoribosylformylglycinamidine cyclo-ligase
MGHSMSKPSSPSDQGKLNYKTAGVDVEAGDALVDWLKEERRPWPHQERIVDGIGGFASLFRIQFPEMKKPCLVTCTDGVGTKVKIAAEFENYSTVGQDLVAMCVNDLICTGGIPLLFLDYYATGKLNLKAAQGFLASVSRACRESECALVGGETAEMPGVYQANDFDCAGFAVGIVDEDKAWGAHRVKSGDRIYALSSSGFHSNGYSLLRRVFEKDLATWKDVLLTPTALYVRVTKAIQAQTEIHAAAHITGGGIENIPRILPEGWDWERRQWSWPEPFKEVQRRTGLSSNEMLTTLNCGIGFCYVAPVAAEKVIRQEGERAGFQVYDLGEVRS